MKKQGFKCSTNITAAVLAENASPTVGEGKTECAKGGEGVKARKKIDNVKNPKWSPQDL